MKEYTPLTDVAPVLSILSHISFLGGISDAQREKIFRLFEVGHFKKGEYISRKGEEATHIHIIEKGTVDLLVGDDDLTIAKRQFHVGDCFGEAAMLSMINNTASFVAAEDCDLIAFSRRSLNQLRREDAAAFSILILNLARELARKLQYTDEMLLRHEHQSESK